MAQDLVSGFGANYGGTDILSPMKEAIKVNTKREKRIFLLTDGQVRNRDAIIDYARSCSKIARFHTFGIGNGCDSTLVKRTAEAGRGCASLVADGDEANLSGLVIKAL